MAASIPPPPPSPVRLSISGAALAALLHRCGAALGDADGLLLGRASLLPPPAASLSDDPPSASPSPAAATLSISISGHSSLSQPSSLPSPLGHLHLPASASPSAVVGWFSSRRRSPLRPSMRELAATLSVEQTLALTRPCVFVLVSPSASANLSTHSFDYRAFLLPPSDRRLLPTTLHVVNIGPVFRDQYNTFAAEAPMPALPHPPAPAEGIGELKRVSGDQKVLEGLVQGFKLDRLESLIGGAAAQAAEMEQLYGGMLKRLEGLAREVEKSNVRVLEQENRNFLLRTRYAGMD